VESGTTTRGQELFLRRSCSLRKITDSDCGRIRKTVFDRILISEHGPLRGYFMCATMVRHMKLQTLEEAGRTFTYTDHRISVPRFVTAQMLDILKKWQTVFPSEASYVSREYGVPSIIVRFDGVVAPEGRFDAYEVQSGCGWTGYAGLVNEAFRDMRDNFVKNKWPPFKLLAPLRKPLENPDELFWLQRTSLKEARESDTLLWVRYLAQKIPKRVRGAIIARSLKPVQAHNSKHYGTALGWWKTVMWHESLHGSALPWDEAFVLKPSFQYGSTDIMLWKPNERTGRATRTQIIQTLQRNGGMYLQRFIAPMRTRVGNNEYNIILRPFFGYDPQEKRWVPMQGVWTGRPYPNLRIHGASDAISGPLYMEA